MVRSAQLRSEFTVIRLATVESANVGFIVAFRSQAIARFLVLRRLVDYLEISAVWMLATVITQVYIAVIQINLLSVRW